MSRRVKEAWLQQIIAAKNRILRKHLHRTQQTVLRAQQAERAIERMRKGMRQWLRGTR